MLCLQTMRTLVQLFLVVACAILVVVACYIVWRPKLTSPPRVAPPHGYSACIRIYNGVNHCEIIESLCVNIGKVFPGLSLHSSMFDIHADTDDKEFGQYIIGKYPNVVHYGDHPATHVLHATTMPEDAIARGNEPALPNVKYVQHRFDPSCDRDDNVYLLPHVQEHTRNPCFLPSALPEVDRSYGPMPVYVVQGRFARRDLTVIRTILEHVGDVSSYRIRIVGSAVEGVPEILDEISDDPRIEVHKDLSFRAFHEAFTGAYGVLPCVDREQHLGYYTNQLTSSMSYGVGYQLRFVCESALAELYEVEDAAYAYTAGDPSSICDAFSRSLRDFPGARRRFRTRKYKHADFPDRLGIVKDLIRSEIVPKRGSSFLEVGGTGENAAFAEEEMCMRYTCLNVGPSSTDRGRGQQPPVDNGVCQLYDGLNLAVFLKGQAYDLVLVDHVMCCLEGITPVDFLSQIRKVTQGTAVFGVNLINADAHPEYKRRISSFMTQEGNEVDFAQTVERFESAGFTIRTVAELDRCTMVGGGLDQSLHNGNEPAMAWFIIH